MTPLRRARNLGPVSARELAGLGIQSLEQLREIGWREACLMWAERCPRRINLNAFRSVIGAVYGVSWNEIPVLEDLEARSLIASLRRDSRKRPSL